MVFDSMELDLQVVVRCATRGVGNRTPVKYS